MAQLVRQRRADTLEMVHTLAFQVQLVMAWRYSLAIVSHHREQSLGARTAVALGLVLLAVNTLYLDKYFVHKARARPRARRAGLRPGRAARRGAALAPPDLHARMRKAMPIWRTDRALSARLAEDGRGLGLPMT